MDSTGVAFPRSIRPTLARDSELRVESGRGLLCWTSISIKPEFERCLRGKQVDGVHSIGAGAGRRSSGKGMYISS